MSVTYYTDEAFQIQVAREELNMILFEINIGHGTPVDIGEDMPALDLKRVLIEYINVLSVQETEEEEYPVRPGDEIWCNGELVDFVTDHRFSRSIH